VRIRKPWRVAGLALLVSASTSCGLLSDEPGSSDSSRDEIEVALDLALEDVFLPAVRSAAYRLGTDKELSRYLSDFEVEQATEAGLRAAASSAIVATSQWLRTRDLPCSFDIFSDADVSARAVSRYDDGRNMAASTPGSAWGGMWLEVHFESYDHMPALVDVVGYLVAPDCVTGGPLVLDIPLSIDPST
jgi:hypothetical protein